MSAKADNRFGEDPDFQSGFLIQSGSCAVIYARGLIFGSRRFQGNILPCFCVCFHASFIFLVYNYACKITEDEKPKMKTRHSLAENLRLG